PVDQVVGRLSRAGIGNGTQVVLYSATNPMWATRVWWMLRAVGFDNAMILNGGLAKWVAEKRPVAQGIDAYEPAEFKPAFRPELFVGKQKVLAALGDGPTLLIHALSRAVFEGRNQTYIFGRKGRIPGSINLPAEELHDPASGAYHPAHVLRAMFEDVGASQKDPVICYCGGGVNATNNAFVMFLLGYDNVTVYDGSMSEWGNDPSLPVEQ
ncbi:Thiosulfate sulfurtransferase, rhodanese, partial [hydrothermal vent metagenome]